MSPAMTPGWQTSCFSSLLAVALTLVHRFHPYPGTEVQVAEEVIEEYDFVIIGGGSAGNVVANRLSENEDWTVLLLEAGGHENELSQIPSQSGRLHNTRLDWQYLTAPPTGNESYCLAMNNFECKWPRGKVLGGSSVINGMLYVRGNRNDYDHWASLGNEGWDYDQVLEYFLKSEDNSNLDLVSSPYHAAGGYLSVQEESYRSKVADMILQSGVSIGYENHDINGKNQSGFVRPQFTQRHGARCSTTRAFILPAETRPNLSISLHSFVTKINFECSNSKPRASSVMFTKQGKVYTVKAKKEIILSAGAIGSPHILMLSGIGPKEHLEEFDIKSVNDLRVGQNLQDHVAAQLTFRLGVPTTPDPADAMSPDSLLQYFLESDGPLSANAITAIAFVNTKFAHSSGSYPDVEFHVFTQSLFNSAERPIGQVDSNLRPDLFLGSEFEKLQNQSLFDISVCVQRPKSRGYLRLRSSNPYDHPIIDPNFFAEREDVDVLVAGLRNALDLMSTPPFEAVNATALELPFPGCEEHELYSNTYLECFIRHFTRTVYHPSGTCAMGVTPDAVVDPQLRVIGVDGLLVIDASVMPTIVSGNLNAPTIMIAEKGSDMIKQYWSK